MLTNPAAGASSASAPAVSGSRLVFFFFFFALHPGKVCEAPDPVGSCHGCRGQRGELARCRRGV